MVHVIASIRVKTGHMLRFLDIFKKNIPNVLAEDGCNRYELALDVETGFRAQGPLRPDVATVIEAWDSLDALRAHLAAPHMETYKQAVANIVEDVKLQVVEPVA